MTTELKIVGQRGGNRHPVAVQSFILDYLSIVGEDYIASIHRAYKAELGQAAISRGRKYAYHKPTYNSFEKVVNKMAREGIVEFSGREEESDNPMFTGREWKPVRRYYRLVTGAPILTGHEDGHKLALKTRISTDETGRQETSVS